MSSYLVCRNLRVAVRVNVVVILHAVVGRHVGLDDTPVVDDEGAQAALELTPA